MKHLEDILLEIQEDVITVINDLSDDMVSVPETGALLLGDEIRKEFSPKLEFLEYINPDVCSAKLNEITISEDSSDHIYPRVLTDVPSSFDRLVDNIYSVYHDSTIFLDFVSRTKNGATLKHQYNLSRYDLQDFVIDVAKLVMNFKADERLFSIYFDSLEFEDDSITPENAEMLCKYTSEYAKLNSGFKIVAPTYLLIGAAAIIGVKQTMKVLKEALHFNRSNNPNNPSANLQEGEILFHMADRLPKNSQNKQEFYEKSFIALQKAERMQYEPQTHFSEFERKIVYQGMARTCLGLSKVTEGDVKSTYLANCERCIDNSITFGLEPDDLLNQGLMYKELFDITVDESKKQDYGKQCYDSLEEYMAGENVYDSDLFAIMDSVSPDDSGDNWNDGDDYSDGYDA